MYNINVIITTNFFKSLEVSLLVLVTVLVVLIKPCNSLQSTSRT